jgi:Fe-S-cluster containining protein
MRERQSVLVEVPSGEIRTEIGADGLHLVFDCHCLDAQKYCKSNCCAMPGTVITEEEFQRIGAINPSFVMQNPMDNDFEMQRGSDGWCNALDRETGNCTIYEERPNVCRVFHCSQNVQRGWKTVISRLVY